MEGDDEDESAVRRDRSRLLDVQGESNTDTAYYVRGLLCFRRLTMFRAKAILMMFRRL
jgi:hypothetical protein